MFKVIIAGNRNFDNYKYLKSVCDYMFANRNQSEIEIVSGACSVGTHTFTRPDGTKVYGADGLGEKYAEENKYPVKPFPADWKLGKKAGYIRNKQMAEYADALIAFYDGKSKGTKMMIDLAREHKLKLRISNYVE